MGFPGKMKLVLATLFFVAGLACRTADVFIAEATVAPTRTLRPTNTALPTPTYSPVPTDTATPAPTIAPVQKTPTRRPATPKSVIPSPRPTTAPQSTVSPYEFHANPPIPCAHSGLTYLKGSVYNDKNDPNNKYIGAIVALGPPDGSKIYDVVKTDSYGEYTFVLGGPGQANPGTWAIWLVDPTHNRKSDISAPITTNNLPADNPASCWTSGVDFWK
ncbi:hypothetical protein ANRL1_03796 [Anaerolineae bacterium]|nr:hypothetical protein ANRL1_03796 [Anaerolineae bacterium]